MDDHIKDQISVRLEEYLGYRGIDCKKPFRCLNPDHPDRHPSMVFDPKRNRAHCFSCGVDYDIYDIIGIDYGIPDFPGCLNKAKQIFGAGAAGTVRTAVTAAPPDDVSRYIRSCHSNVEKTDYISGRGISKATAARFMLGYDENFKTGGDVWRAVIIPNGEGYIARNTDTEAGDKNRIRKRGPGGLFNPGALWSAEEPVFIVEGEFDALSICEAGGEAVALGSVSNWRQLVELVSKIRPKAPLILTLDRDDAGKRCTEQLEEALGAADIPFFTAELPDFSKDPSEALTASPGEFFSFVEEHRSIEKKLRALRAGEYMANRTSNYLRDFVEGIAGSVDTPHISTGFNDFDRKLDGGLFEGLYIIGAITSLGKTTFALQMADQMAERGQDVLIFSLEMARNELIAKSVSRLTLLYCLEHHLELKNAKTARGITTGSRYEQYSELEREIITRSVRVYEHGADRLYIQEGIGDIGVQRIREAVERHAECMGKPPVVIVDYLQILAPHSERMSDKQNTDRAVLELKRISRDFKIPVVGISSFNRQNYAQSVTMEAFKESGAIEYSSDVLIGLQLQGAGTPGFEVMEEKKKNPRAVELVVLKNRNGAAGVSTEFEYYPQFNYFREA